MGERRGPGAVQVTSGGVKGMSLPPNLRGLGAAALPSDPGLLASPGDTGACRGASCCTRSQGTEPPRTGRRAGFRRISYVCAWGCVNVPRRAPGSLGCLARVLLRLLGLVRPK